MVHLSRSGLLHLQRIRRLRSGILIRRPSRSGGGSVWGNVWGLCKRLLRSVAILDPTSPNIHHFRGESCCLGISSRCSFHQLSGLLATCIRCIFLLGPNLCTCLERKPYLSCKNLRDMKHHLEEVRTSIPEERVCYSCRFCRILQMHRKYCSWYLQVDTLHLWNNREFRMRGLWLHLQHEDYC